MSRAELRTPPAEGRPTARPPSERIVMAVACEPRTVERCRELALNDGAMFYTCNITVLATVAAALRPLAIVLPGDVYAFDPKEFDVLARDVRAALVVLESETISSSQLEAQLRAAMQQASLRRSRTG